MRRFVIPLCAVTCVAIAGVALTAQSQTQSKPETRHRDEQGDARRISRAVCVIHGLDKSGVEGGVTFTQREGYVEVDVEVTGLTPGLHGFHIHEYGDCTMVDGSCAGGHFNPANMPHGGPESAKRHVGDLGNLVADKEGVAEFQLNDKVIQLNGPHSVIGRSIIIHEKADDLKSQPSGDAGKRIACGVIGIAKPE